MNKLILTILTAAFAGGSFAHAGNICDAEAVDCAHAKTNFMCSGSVSSSTLIAPNTWDVSVGTGCGFGVNVIVKWDGLSCTCTSVTSPGDGG